MSTSPREPLGVFMRVCVCVLQLLCVLLIQYERIKGVQSSGVLLVFWLLALLCATATFRSKVLAAISEVGQQIVITLIRTSLFYCITTSSSLIVYFNIKGKQVRPKQHAVQSKVKLCLSPTLTFN